MRSLGFFSLLGLMVALADGGALWGNGNGGRDGCNGDGSACIDEATAIRELEKRGGEVFREESVAGKPVTKVVLSGRPVLTGQPLLPITDASLDFLRAFPHLKELGLYCTGITDTGLRSVTNPHLKELDLHLTHVTDAGLRSVTKLSELRVLDLDGTNITDAGLRSLTKLSELRVLGVDGTKITDAGLKELTKLKHLRVLGVGDTDVSAAGKEKLQRALPRLKIHTEWEHQTGVVIPPTVIP
jgi:internalin A